MAETEEKVRDQAEQQTEATGSGEESPSAENGAGRSKLKAAGVAAAVVSGAAVAVGDAREREKRAWSRLEESMRDGAAGPTEAGDPTRPAPPITVPELLWRTVERHGAKAALQYRAGKELTSISYRELAERVANFALGLTQLGVQKGDRVALLSENCPEWAIADLAILSLGAVNVPLYATLPPPQVQHITSDSGAVALIVQNAKQLEKALEVRDRLPDLKQLVLIEAEEAAPEGVTSFAAVEHLGAEQTDRVEFERRWHAVQPEDLASIIYTSGTTGLPKGAMLTHDNFTSNAQSLPPLVDIRADDTFLSWLPLAHVFERMAGHYLPLLAGSTVCYSEGLRHLAREMGEVQPTIMASVPRLYESIQARVLDEVAKLPPVKRKLFHWALEVGARYNGPRKLGERPGIFATAEYRVADRLVLSKIRARSGGQLRFFISGGAPLAVETDRFFTAVGWTVLQGYGLTETSPVISINRPGNAKFGTVGPPVPGVLVRIAEDGEILSKGPHIMQGYYNQPEETAKVIDSDGWFHTGDIGCLDADGFLRITDRKKDLLVLANGKNVAPQPIEELLRASPYIGTAALFGDRQPVVAALIVPNFTQLERWARERGIAAEPRAELLKHAEVRTLYKQEIDAAGAGLADYEKVRRFALLECDFSQEAGELTPTLKLKRRVVAEKYAGTLAALHGGGAGDGG